MTRVFLVVGLERLEPGTDDDPDRRHILVAPLASDPLRYRVIGGHRRYWRAVADGDERVTCEITDLETPNDPRP